MRKEQEQVVCWLSHFHHLVLGDTTHRGGLVLSTRFVLNVVLS